MHHKYCFKVASGFLYVGGLLCSMPLVQDYELNMCSYGASGVSKECFGSVLELRNISIL